MSCEDEQSLAEEGTGVLDPALLPSDVLCCLTAELLRKGQLSFLRDVKQLLSTPGHEQRTLGEPLQWLAEGGGGGGGRKALSCTRNAHQGSVCTQPLHSAVKQPQARLMMSPVVLLTLCSCPRDWLPMPCPCPARALPVPCLQHQPSCTFSTAHNSHLSLPPALPHPAIPHPSTARSLLSRIHYPKSIKKYF